MQRTVITWIQILAGGLATLAPSCVWSQSVATSSLAEPPVADVRPHEFKDHGVSRTDEYYWLRERDDPDVLQYLKQENAYTAAMLLPTQELQQTISRELKERELQSDWTVPYPDGDWWYYSRTEDGRQYRIHCRRPKSSSSRELRDAAQVAALVQAGAEEQIVLDVNVVARGHAYCSAAAVEPTRDGRILAYAVDLVGRRRYDIRFRDLETGTPLPDVIKDVTPDLLWAADNATLFYVRQDPQTLRSYQVYRHRLGTDPTQDQMVYEEADPEFSVSLSLSRSKKLIFIGSYQTLSSEVRVLDADRPESMPRVFLPRRPNHEYQVDHLGDTFYVVTNDAARNFRCMTTQELGSEPSTWQEVIPHQPDRLLEDVVLADDYLIAVEQGNAETRLRVLDRTGRERHTIEFDETAYSVFPAPTEETSTPWLRLVYTSLSTPPSTLQYNVETKEQVLLKQQTVLGGFDAKNYRSERLWVTARDGTKVPVSLVQRTDTRRDGTAPALIYGYGSYGASMPAAFSSDTVSLLDRGWVYAIAHIRGGQEMGRSWYEDGKLLKKMNTFTDFIDVTEALQAQKFADPDRTYAFGGSAGGLLMGAIANMRPDLYDGIIAAVPFVDVITTMLDDTIPLTTSEYDEWGNPQERQYFDYMLAYSPYDQVREQEYPHLLVTTGLHDSQVQYWEPAKWVARLRTRKTDDHLLLLKTNMDAGHGGASGRYDRYREAAERYAFLIHLANGLETTSAAAPH